MTTSANQDLPSLPQLRRATLVAVVIAAMLVVTAVLPAEYGIDPTGLGRRLGLTQMGRLKQELAREAEADARADSLAATSTASSGAVRRHVAWEGMLLGIGGSKLRGDVEMVAGGSPGTTEVDLRFARDAAGAVRPWHVHVGSCAKAGPVLGASSAYPVLRVDGKGAAEGKATLRIALPDSGSYYVNIHESAAAMSKIVACGDLLLEE